MLKKQFSIRLELDLYEQLDNYRWTNRTTLNEAVTEAVEQFLADKLMKSKEEQNNPSVVQDGLPPQKSQEGR